MFNVFCFDTFRVDAFVGLGPVVQSIISLTSPLRGQLVKRITTL